MPNVTTNFLPADEHWKMAQLPMKASTAMVEGAAIGIEISGNDVTGNHTLMGVENAAGADFVGILAEPIAATDADYATAGKLKSVKIARSKDAEMFFTVGEGTFTAADVGRTVQFGSTSIDLDVDTAGKGARISQYISSTRGKCQPVLPNTETA
jgi:hypothetical protein